MNSEIINSKSKNYCLRNKGLFGNKLKTWDSVEEIKKSGFKGNVSIRYKLGSRREKMYSYNVSLDEIESEINSLIKKGAQKEFITFNESAPDEKLTIQGEIIHVRGEYYLFYSKEKGKMNDVLENGKHMKGMQVLITLKQLMDPSSWRDMKKLLEQYPEHAIEFSTYSINLGNLPHRNTVIWEVRKY